MPEALELWKGYVAHSLLFYRQNNLKRFSDLPRLGRALAIEANEPDQDVARGLRCHERYWGSFRISDKALAHFDRSHTAWGRLMAGMTHEMHRRYARAIVCLEEAMRLEPRWSWPYILRGICLWYTAEFKKSIRDFERAAKLDPKSELPLLFLGRAKSDIRDRSLIKDLDRAVRLAPRSGFALSWRGRAHFVLRRKSEALEDLRKSIRLLPDYDRGYSWLGISYVEQGRLRPALGLLKKAAKLNPFYPTTLYPLARIQLRMGKVDEAGRTLKAAAAIDRHGIWVEHRISRDHANPACLRSLQDIDAFLKARPKTAWALAWRGQTSLLLQRPEEALPYVADARDPWTFLWRGEAYRRLGEYERALADFSKSPKLTWALAGSGFCLLRLGRPKEALALLNRSLELQGHCPEALSWRAEAFFQLGRIKEAVQGWEAALELRHHDLVSREGLWRAKARLRDWEGARRELESISQAVGSQSDQALAALGWVRARQGDRRGAEEALRGALSLNPANALALAAKRDLRLPAGKAQALYDGRHLVK